HFGECGEVRRVPSEGNGQSRLTGEQPDLVLLLLIETLRRPIVDEENTHRLVVEDEWDARRRDHFLPYQEGLLALSRLGETALLPIVQGIRRIDGLLLVEQLEDYRLTVRDHGAAPFQDFRAPKIPRMDRRDPDVLLFFKVFIEDDEIGAQGFERDVGDLFKERL